ncbi:MAG TPA: tetratricopeptide repeat protein, partial [Pirellulales bacterium]
MFRALKPACVLLLLMAVSISGRTAAAESWVGVQIMPKSANALLRVGGQIVGDVSSVHWPTAVKTVDGTWLWVEDDGSTSHPRVAGWLRSSDALQVNDEAVNYFSNRLLDAPDDGGLYWLRGMCWENSGEYKLAAKDYQDAIALEPSHLHASLALARTTAKETYDEKLFLAAQQRNPAHPGLYVDWGHALEVAKLDEQAGPKYQEAVKLSPNWWRPHYSLGMLNSSQGNQAAALANLEDAIRRDPKCHFAYCERAKILLSSKKDLSE